LIENGEFSSQIPSNISEACGLISAEKNAYQKGHMWVAVEAVICELVSCYHFRGYQGNLQGISQTTAGRCTLYG
jgi:hypothetical protein